MNDPYSFNDSSRRQRGALSGFGEPIFQRDYGMGEDIDPATGRKRPYTFNKSGDKNFLTPGQPVASITPKWAQQPVEEIRTPVNTFGNFSNPGRNTAGSIQSSRNANFY